MHVWPSMTWMLRYAQDIPACGLIIPQSGQNGANVGSLSPASPQHTEAGQTERGGQSEGEINSFFNTRCACPCLPDNMLRLMCESRQARRRLREPAWSLSTAVAAATSHCTLVVTWGRAWRGTRGLKQTWERWMFLDVMKGDYTQFPARARSISPVVV